MFSRPGKTKIVDRLRQDRRNFFMLLAGESFIGMPLAWIAAVTVGVSLFGPLAYVAAAGSNLFSVGRLGLFYDFYARRLNDQGKGNRFTHKFCEQWAKTPLRHLSQWKHENDERDLQWRSHAVKLDERFLAAASKQEKKVRKRDIKSFLHILNKLYPNRSLIWAPMGFAVATLSARQIVRNVMTKAMMHSYIVNGVFMILGAAYGAAHLSVFSLKKMANRTNNHLTDKVAAIVEATPARLWTRRIIRRQMRGLDRLNISPELTQDLVDLGIDQTLKALTDYSRAKPKGMLKSLFEVSATNSVAANTAIAVVTTHRPPVISPPS